MLAVVLISLELHQSFRLHLVPSFSAHEDLDWRTTIDLKRRLQAREELKAEGETVETRELVGKEQITPELEQTEIAIQNAISEPEETEIALQNANSEPGSLRNATDVSGNSTKRDTKPRGNTKVRSLRRAAQLAWKAGRKAWKELESTRSTMEFTPRSQNRRETHCTKSIFMAEHEIEKARHFMEFPCGLTIGSSITVVATPRSPHFEYKPSIGRITNDESPSSVSQFMFELHGSRESEYEEPPRILHINPRLKGDWSDKPVIEQNSFYRGQWRRSQRCDGSRSQYHETVEGLLKCEKWWQGDQERNDSSWWLRKLVGRMDKPEINWPYPFSHNRSFILTVRAGSEGYHTSVDGRHVTSFPYTTGLLEEDTAGAFVGGDVDLQAIIATSLPSMPPKTLDEQIFENWMLWKTPAVQEGPIDLFIGVLSASSHFSERMAVRSTWFQSEPIQSSKVVARFFVAMHPDRDINMQMKKEAEYYGDMVILPFMDDYQLVVLKTMAICEFGVRNVSTKYIMKCDDDTFIRVDAVLNELKGVAQAENLYMGNLNMYHRPLRTGKWAVTFEEWPDEEYPTYANGPGYIISRKIASYIVIQKRKRALELFKMEDVSMGLWVKQFQHNSESVQYVHSWKFYQAGCENGYITAHYQLPRQMLCMWKKLLKGEVQCCNADRKK